MTRLEQDHLRRDQIRSLQSNFEQYMIACVDKAGCRSSFVVVKFAESVVDALIAVWGHGLAKEAMNQILAERGLDVEPQVTLRPVTK